MTIDLTLDDEVEVNSYPERTRLTRVLALLHQAASPAGGSASGARRAARRRRNGRLCSA
jgi:hypothetical protein